MPDVLTLAALRALVSLSQPAISPDGTRIAYVRTARDFRADRTVSSIVVVPAAGGAPQVIDRGPDDADPSWSPDGRAIAFTRVRKRPGDRNAGAERALVVRELGGGERVVAAPPRGIQHFAWSPDGRRFVYDTPDPEPNAAAAKRHDDLFVVDDLGFLDDAPATPSHLWLVPSTGGTPRRLTHGAWSVYEAVAPFVGGSGTPSWSRDGRTILFLRAPDANDQLTDHSWAATVDVATGVVRDLPTPRRYVYFPTFSPGGGRYAYIRPHGPGPISAMNVVIGAPGTTGTDRTAALDRDVWGFTWGGRDVVATVTDGLRRAIVVVPPNGAPHRVAIGALSVGDVDAAKNGEIAFVGSTFSSPPELYVVLHAGAAPRALTHENAALARLRYPHAEAITWTAPDGLRSEGILVHPLGERPGKRYPLLVWQHGGPEYAHSLSFDEGTDEGYPVGVLEASRGIAVLLPNYRGSDDLGTAHEHAIYRDPGAGPFSDVLAGLATAEDKIAVDRSRICVGGHSYGGYMTSWEITHDRRWRCAVIGDGAADWTQEYALSADGNLAFARDSLGGAPWGPTATSLYRDGSPLTFIADARTPSLILTGLRDQTVPFTVSWMLYHALKDDGVQVRLIAIPTAHHTPRDPVRLEGYEREIWNWLGRWLL